MIGKEIINHVVRAEMPDMEQFREKCLQQATLKPKTTYRRAWISASAATACLALVLTLTLMLNLGGGTVAYALSITMPNGNSVLMEDRKDKYKADDLATSVSYVDSYPELRFFITGEDIAKIEITSVNEYVSVEDF